MSYRIAGLDPQLFAPLFALDDGALAARNACRIEATSDRGYPCRISLDWFTPRRVGGDGS